MKRNIYFKIIIFLAVSVTLLLTGCSNQLIEYDVENKWIDAIKENDIDYKKFSFAAQNSIYEMRPDYISDFTPDVIKNIKGMLSLSDASEMEKDAIVSAAMEDVLIYVYVLRAYANAKAIDYAIDEYCQKCYESEAIVKEGKYTFKLSASSHNGKIKYNGKISDLKNYLNKYIQPEARNGYCTIEINSYNTPIFVCWSKDKIDKEVYEESVSYQSFNVEEIQNGVAVVGTYPGNFSIRNFITNRIISRTSISSYSGDLGEGVLTSEDFEDLFDDITFILECDIDDSIYADEFKTKENKKSIANFDGKTQSINSEEQFTQNCANAKNVHTASTAACAQAYADAYVDGKEYDIPTGWIDGEGTRLTKNGKTLDLTTGLGSDFKDYMYVHIDEYSCSVLYAVWSSEPIPQECKDLLSMHGELTKDEALKYGVGCYPMPY